MVPVQPTRLRSALAATDLERVCAQILKFASNRARSHDLGAELAQKVLAEAIDPEGSPWNPDHEPDFFRHLVGRVNGALAAERKRLRLRAAPHFLEAVANQVYGPVPTPDDALDERARRELWDARWKTVRRSFEDVGNEVARKVLDQYELGNCSVAGQQSALGEELATLYRERERIVRRARALREKESPSPSSPLLARAADGEGEVGT
jgi:hypothetical protein